MNPATSALAMRYKSLRRIPFSNSTHRGLAWPTPPLILATDHRLLECGVLAQQIAIVRIFIRARDLKHTLADQVRHRVINVTRMPIVR